MEQFSHSRITVVVRMFVFDTNDTRYIIRGVDPGEQYTIVICSINTIGESCSDVIVTTIGESATV